jgi:hypothetical protein
VSLAQDPRWRRLHDRGYACPCCGRRFEGLFDIAFERPDTWEGAPAPLPNGALALDRDILTEDFCVQGPHRFVRCILPLPVQGAEERFAFGLWGTIKPDCLPEVVARFDDGTQGALGPYFSWLGNRLPGTDASPVRASMHMQDNRQRPILMIEDEAHPYFARQREGISFDELLDIYAACGTDLRPHLLDG